MARTSDKKTGISDYFSDIGKPISYFPSFRKITTTTNSAILLCQFLFWSRVTGFNWFFKDAYDLEEETGLTYKEQKNAREILVNLGIIQEKYDRINHTMYFRIDRYVLNERWEQNGGQQTKLVDKEEIDKVEARTPSFDVTLEPDDSLEAFKKEIAEKKKAKTNTINTVSTEKRGDYQQLMIDTGQSVGYKRTKLKEDIFNTVSRRLGVNPIGRNWDEFLEFAINRHVIDKQHISKFLDWAVNNGFDPVYWPPQKLMTLWPQAFLTNKVVPIYVENEPIEEKEVAPMPKQIRRKS